MRKGISTTYSELKERAATERRLRKLGAKLKKGLALLIWPLRLFRSSYYSIVVYNGQIPVARINLFNGKDDIITVTLCWTTQPKFKKPRSPFAKFDARDHMPVSHVNTYYFSPTRSDFMELAAAIRSLRPTRTEALAHCSYTPALNQQNLPEYPKYLRSHAYGPGRWILRDLAWNRIRTVEDAGAYLMSKCGFTQDDVAGLVKAVRSDNELDTYYIKVYPNGSMQLFMQICRILSA